MGKLDPFKDFRRQRVAAAQPHWIPATVLACEIREQGFTGRERLVSRFVRRSQVSEEYEISVGDLVVMRPRDRYVDRSSLAALCMRRTRLDRSQDAILVAARGL